MSFIPKDNPQREEALDPTRSFIVQAPAGSGKTELLTRRFLKLLGCACNEPEEIIAITFTRKAASEMRERIIKSLEKGMLPPPSPDQPSYVSWQLAQSVLKQNKIKNWQLLNTPSRLRIMTIDSLCANLTRQMPITSQFGCQPMITDDSRSLYSEAARNLFNSLTSEEDPANNPLKDLLLHLDNQATRLEVLFINMLSHRDQWLGLIHSGHQREALENCLYNCQITSAQNCLDECPKELLPEICKLAEFSSNQLMIATPLIDENNLTFENWQQISTLLLGSNNTWRKSVNQRQGFPAASSTSDPELKNILKVMKARVSSLLEQLHTEDKFRQALEDIKFVPPSEYTEQQWDLLTNLFKLMPRLVAELMLVFKQQRSVDFIEVAMRAQQALGSSDNPTDLALRLDYKIQHLLVDEFQDTSVTQFRLFHHLTENWHPDDHRTIFLVGDPMQSIYRFRQAEVGLFLNVWENGFGNIPINSLRLNTNFRSHPDVIHWLNKKFDILFPEKPDIKLGAVPFSFATPGVKEEKRISDIRVIAIKNGTPETEAEKICHLIKEKHETKPGSSIAILVRSRTHLPPIINALQRANINYQGTEIETLSDRAIIQDLYSLTRAMLHPADRVAWLSLLRAPWCGLSMKDIYQISTLDSEAPIWQNINNLNTNLLSEGAPARLNRLKEILNISINQRGRYPLRQWIKWTWETLGGPACINNSNDLNNANRFFELLEQLEKSGDISDFSNFETKLHQLYAATDPKADSSLQIMTIHKSKGLEFDTVILPALDRSPRPESAKLLRWLEITREDNEADIIIAPIQARNESDPIYKYLMREERKCSRNELLRLCYVAATRAKDNIYLTACTTDKNPAANSLLELMYPALEKEVQNSQINEETIQDKEEKIKTSDQLIIERLSDSWTPPIDSTPIYQITTPTKFEQDEEENQENKSQRIVGTIVHNYLQKIAEQGLESWSASRIDKCKNKWRNDLIEAGFYSDIENQILVIRNALVSAITDDTGRWILDKHQESQAEYAITVAIGDSWQNYIIDRTFIDNDERWIIDYKTTAPKPGVKLETFLAEQKQNYQLQLQNYAETLRKIDSRKIRVGLYFPLIAHCLKWDFEEHTNDIAQ